MKESWGIWRFGNPFLNTLGFFTNLERSLERFRGLTSSPQVSSKQMSYTPRSRRTLQYSCLENPLDRGAWQTTDHGVSKNRTQLSKHLQDFPLKVLHPGNCLSPQKTRVSYPTSQVPSVYLYTLNQHSLQSLTRNHLPSPTLSRLAPGLGWALAPRVP